MVGMVREIRGLSLYCILLVLPLGMLYACGSYNNTKGDYYENFCSCIKKTF
jgi:hypothetical protein